LGTQCQGIRACANEGGYDHIDGDIMRAHDKGDHTDFRHHSDSTIADQLSRIRIKEEDIEVHQRAVVQGHDEGEILLDKDSVAIHIGRIKDTPSDGDTIAGKHLAKELGGERRSVRFHLAKQDTAAAIVVAIVMVSPGAPS